MNLPRPWRLEDVFSAEGPETPARRLLGKKDLLFGLSLCLGCLGLVCLLLAVLSAAHV